MGSSFSIVNDTDKPIWVSYGVCHVALWGSIGGVAAIIMAVGAIAVAAANGRPVTAKTVTDSVSSSLSVAVNTIARLSQKDQKQMLSLQKQLQEKLKGYKRIEPGCKYSVTGSLSLVWTAYVIYDDGKEAKCDCWTGATAGSENLYPVSKYF